MLLANSISGTKKFFQKTLGGLKSFFSKGYYQKLPKSPTTPQPYTVVDDIFYTREYWDHDSKLNHVPAADKSMKKITSTPTKQGQEFRNGSLQRRREEAYPNEVSNREDDEYYEYSSSWTAKQSREDGRSWLVAEKLRELEMLDVSNVDHNLDIEEVLHYYSRLTCPAYLEIVDNFFWQIYSEFFHNPTTPSRSTAKFSRFKPRSLIRS